MRRRLTLYLFHEYTRANIVGTWPVRAVHYSLTFIVHGVTQVFQRYSSAAAVRVLLVLLFTRYTVEAAV